MKSHSWMSGLVVKLHHHLLFKHVFDHLAIVSSANVCFEDGLLLKICLYRGPFILVKAVIKIYMIEKGLEHLLLYHCDEAVVYDSSRFLQFESFSDRLDQVIIV